MKTKVLNPIEVDNHQAELIEDYLKKILRDEFYFPLIEVMNDVKIENSMIHNSKDPLIESIRKGDITYEKGEFKGKFDSKSALSLRKMGAKFNKKNKSYMLERSKIPSLVKKEVLIVTKKMNDMVERLMEKLSQISPKTISKKINLDKLYSKQISKIDDQIKDQISAMTVYQKLNPEQVKRIAENYTNNMKLYIRGWVDERIVDLRKKVAINVKKGIRYENMYEEISKSYTISKSKAKFLARQETNLLTVEMQKERYLKAGVNDYEWRTVVGSPKHPVRDLHKVLDRTKHSWDNPPIVNKKKDRKHPGQDFNCRCKAFPIVRFE